jgi:hypothetical protein
MDYQKVKSSNISEVGYDPETKTLGVKFHNGGVAHYHDVAPEKHTAMMAAESIGKHLHAHIKDVHKFTKVT